MSDLGPLEYLSKSQDLMDLNEFMDDENVAYALDMAIKCFAKPDLPTAAAKKVVIQLEALSFQMKMKAQLYMTVRQGKAGTAENKKKNVYFSMAECLHELSMALRYMARD